MENEVGNRNKTELTGKEKRMLNLKRDAGPGRPKGQRNFETIYIEAMKILANKNSTTVEKLEAEMVANAAVLARKGDFRFYKDMMDRLHGTATQKIDHTSAGDKIVFIPSDVKDKLKSNDSDTATPETNGSNQLPQEV